MWLLTLYRKTTIVSDTAMMADVLGAIRRQQSLAEMSLVLLKPKSICKTSISLCWLINLIFDLYRTLISVLQFPEFFFDCLKAKGFRKEIYLFIISCKVVQVPDRHQVAYDIVNTKFQWGNHLRCKGDWAVSLCFQAQWLQLGAHSSFSSELIDLLSFLRSTDTMNNVFIFQHLLDSGISCVYANQILISYVLKFRQKLNARIAMVLILFREHSSPCQTPVSSLPSSCLTCS